MGSRARRMMATLGLALGGAYLLAGPGTSCGSYLATTALAATDFCFIFDCQNGILGGTIDPCATTNGVGPLFADCPNANTGP
jgi:hypothetical protein